MAYVNALPVTDKGVRTQHPDYKQYKNQWQMCRDAIDGEAAIKKAGETYLPKLRKQDANAYNAYVMRGSFYNATGRTVEGLEGMIFRKPPVLDVPTGIDELLDDVDMCNSPIEVFARELVEECISIGRVGLLVDHTPALTLPNKPVTIADVQQNNIRPSLKIYTSETITNWKFKQINNVYTLCQVVLTEQFTQPAIDPITRQPSEFANIIETRYRVLDLLDDQFYRVRVFRINDHDDDEQVGDDEIPLMNNQPLNFIPFYIMTPDGLSFSIEEPPIMDLVNVNLAHWRNSADYEHGCHYTALPTLFIAGYTATIPENGEPPTEISLGSESAIVITDPAATAQFIEFTGQGLGAIQTAMDRKESQMGVLGARMIAQETKAAETATTTAMRRTGENSILADIAIGCSLGLSKGITVFSKWANYDQECTIKLNRDFLPVAVDGVLLSSILKAYQAGTYSKQELFDWMQRVDMIEAEVTYEQHLKGDFEVPAPVIAPGASGNSVSTPPIAANPENS